MSKKNVQTTELKEGRDLEGATLEEAKVEAGNAFLRVHQIVTLSRRLEGKILTICDAIIYNDKQNKAVKDLIRDALHEFRFKAEMVGEGSGDEYSVGVATLDIEDTESGFKIPTLIEDKA